MKIPEAEMMMVDIQPPTRMLPPQSQPFQGCRDWHEAERPQLSPPPGRTDEPAPTRH
ncbi:MAG: hypothetical protein VW625_06745 [Perlucidibaca sp.]